VPNLVLLALFAHLLVVFALGARLPDSQTVAPASSQDVHAAHTLPSGVGDPAQDAYFDLTPPEVRSLGGPTLVEVLEAPPALRIPAPPRTTEQLRDTSAQQAPDGILASTHASRAPPVS